MIGNLQRVHGCREGMVIVRLYLEGKLILYYANGVVGMFSSSPCIRAAV